ncbi:MAG: alpha/beta fold hydrolase [Bacilli bacterium]
MEEINLNNKFFLYKSTSNKYAIFVHGMVETMNGYLKVKDYLVNNGINVVLYDNEGHGENAKNLGHLDIYESYKMVNDIIDIEKYINDNYSPSEVVVIGHSMGSALVRSAMKSVKFDKVVLNGAPKSLRAFTSNLLLFIYLFINDKKPSMLFNNLVFKSYNKSVESPTSENDWVCSNLEYLKMYNEDEYSGFIGTGGFYQEVIRVMAMAKEVKINPTNVLITSGKNDPVTNMGKSCFQLKNRLEKHGCNCNVICYENMRHFIYDEIDCNICYEDLLNFINEV